jgi:hypothetical protein
MTNRLDPHHTGPATDPAAEPTPTELLAWLRGREAVVDRKLEAHREGMLRALEVRLEPVTKQLSELQLQADATDRKVDTLKRRLDGHVGYHTAHNTAGLESRLESHIRSADPHSHACEVTGLGEPDGVMVGPSGDGQSDLTMIKYSQLLRDSYRTFMRYAVDPTVTREQFDFAVHEFREQVFKLTSWMRTAVSNREGQGAQAT